MNPSSPLPAHGLTRRHVLSGLAAAGTLAGLGACGGGSASSDAGKLTFFSWDNQETMKPLIDMFQKANPDITVEFSNAPPVAEYISTLQTRILSGTAADVFSIAAENKTNLIDGKLVQDLTGKPFMSDLNEFNVATYSADGKAYGMSISSWGAGILVNTDVLDAAGATTFPTTWDDFLVLCKTLADAGTTPYLESVQGMSTTLSAFLGAQSAAGGGTMDEDIFDGTSTFADTWTEPLTQWSRLWSEKLVTPDVVGLTGDQVRDEFANGRVAMISAGPWDISPLREAAPDLKITMELVPALTGGTPFLAGAASPGWTINAKAKNAAAAEKFLTFLSSAEAVKTINVNTSAITTTSGYEPVVDPALEVVAEEVRNGNIYLPQIAWSRHEDVLNEAAVAQLQLLVQGSTTPEQVAAELDKTLAAQDA